MKEYPNPKKQKLWNKNHKIPQNITEVIFCETLSDKGIFRKSS